MYIRVTDVFGLLANFLACSIELSVDHTWVTLTVEVAARGLTASFFLAQVCLSAERKDSVVSLFDGSSGSESDSLADRSYKK